MQPSDGNPSKQQMRSAFPFCSCPTSHPTNEHPSQQKSPLAWEETLLSTSWLTQEHGGHKHQQFHRPDSRHWRFRKCNKAKKIPTPGPQHSSMISCRWRTSPLQQYGCKIQASCRKGPHQTENQPQMVHWFLSDDNSPPSKQIPCLFKNNTSNASMWMDVPQRTWDKHWAMGPFGSNNPILPSFPQQTSFPHEKSQEKESNRHQWTVPRGSQIPSLCPHNMPKRNWSQLDCIKKANAHLWIGLLPYQLRQI